MRTTLDLKDDLLRRAKIEAIIRGVSLKKLVEDSLAVTLPSPSTKPRRKKVKLPLLGSKKAGKLAIPPDIAHIAQQMEDYERYAASLRR
jgi:hypothetical protein